MNIQLENFTWTLRKTYKSNLFWMIRIDEIQMAICLIQSRPCVSSSLSLSRSSFVLISVLTFWQICWLRRALRTSNVTLFQQTFSFYLSVRSGLLMCFDFVYFSTTFVWVLNGPISQSVWAILCCLKLKRQTATIFFIVLKL